MSAQAELFNGNGFIAEVIRTNRRKTAAIKVHEGKVSVVVPKNLPESRIEELVARKTKWIHGKICLHKQTVPSRPKEYVSGESFTYLGKNYRLKVVVGDAKGVKLKGGQLVVTLPEKELLPEKIQKAITAWYREHAEQKLAEKVKRYAPVVGVTPATVKIKSFKSRWGSCHSNGEIQFNWMIIIAPNHIVDYVVVHELCHLKEHNHSPKFWKCVEQVVPDYEMCRQWLKDNGKKLFV